MPTTSSHADDATTIWGSPHPALRRRGESGPPRLGPGVRVLVVEHDFMLAEDLRERLERRGCQVIGPVDTVAGALAALASGAPPGFAILDTHLEDGPPRELAQALRTSAVPFVFAADLELWGLFPTLGSEPSFAKPVSLAQVEREART